MYILFEGVDGVGKSTTMHAVAAAMVAAGKTRFRLTKEPGGPGALRREWTEKGFDIAPLEDRFGMPYETGPLIRELCVNHPQIPQLTKRALFKADSLSNWTEVIKPALIAEEITLSDRGWISDIVYGSVLLNLDPHSLFNFNMALTPELRDITYVICFEVSKDVREERLATNTVDAMDRLGTDVRDRLQQAYRKLIPQFVRTGHYFYIRTDRSMDEIVEAVMGILNYVY